MINHNLPWLAVELISVEQLASRIGCTRQTVESHRRRGEAHESCLDSFETGTTLAGDRAAHPLRREAILQISPSISAIATASIIGAILLLVLGMDSLIESIL